MSWLESLGKSVCGKPKTVIAIVLVITLLLLPALPGIKIETDLIAFLPENEALKAQNRATEYFGEDPFVHLIYVEERNEENSVLTPVALREMYNLTLEVRDIEGVEETQSIADIFNLLCKYQLNPFTGKITYDENKDLLNTSNKNIRNIQEMLTNVFDGSFDLDAFNISVAGAGVDPKEFGFVFDLFVSEDFDLQNFTAAGALIIVQIDGTLDRAEVRSVAGEIQTRISAMPLENLREMQTSEYLIAYEVESNLRSNMAMLGAAILFLVSLILWSTFRRTSFILVPMLTLLITVIWTFGFSILMGITFTALDIAVIPLILGLGVDYSVHMSKRYQEEMRKGHSSREALVISTANVGAALLLAVLTTVVAFMSNVFSDVGPIRDFGVMCAMGVFIAFFLTLTFHSAFRIQIDEWRDRKVKKKKPKKARSHEGVMGGVSKLVTKHGKPVGVLIIITALLGAYAWSFVPVEFKIEDFVPEDWESIQAQDVIKSNFTAGSYSYIYILIEGGDMASVQAYRDLWTVQRNGADDPFVVAPEQSDDPVNATMQVMDGPYTVIRTAVVRNQSVAMRFNLEPSGLPGPNCTDADVLALYDYLANNESVMDPITGKTYSERFGAVVHHDGSAYSSALVRIPSTAFAGTEIDEAIAAAEADADGTSLGKVTVTGILVLAQTTMVSVQQSQLSSTFISIIFAVVVLVILYRSGALGFIAIIPVVVTMSWSMGTMYLLDIPLNMLTVMITALTVGLGIDYAIHVIERFREERRLGKGVNEAIDSTLKNTGAALLVSSITTVAGFGVLIFAQMPILQQFGSISASMIFYSFLLAVVALPIPLIAWARWKEKRKLWDDVPIGRPGP